MRTFSRRQVLQLAVASSLGALAAACGTEPTAAPTAAVTRIPSPTPGSLIPTQAPTVPPTLAPTMESATSAPATAAPTEAPTVAPTATPAPALAAEVAQAATGFVALLDDGQRAKARYAFDDAERTRWHWTLPRNFPRNGLPLREMQAEQRDAALALLQASVSPAGYQKALDIISLQNDLGNDPELYYVTVFGTPGTEPWGWRFEGHHLSRHFSVVGGQVSVMPFFLGAWPTVNSAGLKAMDREEWAARELVTALPDPLRAGAIFQPNTLTNHVTGNQALVSPLEPVGVLAGELPPEGQALVNEIVFTYLNTLPDSLAQPKLEAIRAAGFENIRFGWAGALEARRPHYYRLQGPTFLLEHDNSRGGGTHIHSVWRDFSDDFALQWL